MDFRKLTLNNVDLLRPLFSNLASKTCDYTVGGMFMWREYYNMEYASDEQAVYTRLTNEQGQQYYALPLSSNIKKALEKLVNETIGDIVRFCTIPSEYIEIFNHIGNQTKIIEQENFFDYFYKASDLIMLNGKKYSGQRNHINQFINNCSGWRFEELTKEHIPMALNLLCSLWNNRSETKDFAIEEHQKTIEVLQNIEAYNMIGGILYADEKPVGFSMGEIIGDVLYTHIEKADRSQKGAHQMLLNQFARHFASKGINYINREEDMGDIGLRTSKLSYHPISVLKKYIVEVSLNGNNAIEE